MVLNCLRTDGGEVTSSKGDKKLVNKIANTGEKQKQKKSGSWLD